jgi:hypothetical protein
MASGEAKKAIKDSTGKDIDLYQTADDGEEIMINIGDEEPEDGKEKELKDWVDRIKDYLTKPVEK